MSRPFSFAIDEFYHLYNRGVEKRLIFMDQTDYDRFFDLLYLANGTRPLESRRRLNRDGGLASVTRGEPLVDIGAHCLMPNHFHLLVREKQEGGLSTFMHKLLTSYTMYFNRRHQRSGSLFETTFKAKHITDDDYLHYMFAYIHLNPIKIINPGWPKTELGGMEQAVEHLKNYRYSSYPDYLPNTDRPEKIVLNRAVFPEYFQQPADFGNLLKDWLLYRAEVDKNTDEL